MSTSDSNDVVWEDGAEPTTATAPDDVVWEDGTYPGGPAQVAGQQTNDVGNTVIVPKDGENFSDTMARAAAQGKKTTKDQINKEVASMYRKIKKKVQ